MEYIPDRLQEQPPEVAARTLVLAKTALFMTQRGLERAPWDYDESVGIQYHLYIKQGKSHWANQQPITDDDRSNFEAADAIMQLPSVLLPEQDNPRYLDAKNILSQDTTWHKKVRDMLVKTALYTPDGNPSEPLQTAAPYLKMYLQKVKHPDDKRLEDENLLLPREPRFIHVFRAHNRTAYEWLAATPKVEYDSSDSNKLLQIVATLKPSQRDLVTVDNLDDPATTSRTLELAPWFEVLETSNSAMYLTLLLQYIKELDELLQTSQ